MAWLAGIICSALSAQTVSNVRTHFDQSKQLLSIHYDVHDLNYKKEIQVLPVVVSDQKLNPVTALAGDFGWQNRGGKNKIMIWDPFKDGATQLNGLKIELTTTIRPLTPPRLWSLAWQGSNSAPFGLKLSRLLPIGFFASFRLGNLPPYALYQVSNSGVIDFKESGVYEIGEERRLASFAITGGPLFQVGRNVYLYLGVGYGLEQLFWRYKEYNLSKVLVGNNWALNEQINSKGTVIETGATIRLGRITLDLGSSSINFNSIQLTGGIGFTFTQNK